MAEATNLPLNFTNFTLGSKTQSGKSNRRSTKANKAEQQIKQQIEEQIEQEAQNQEAQKAREASTFSLGSHVRSSQRSSQRLSQRSARRSAQAQAKAQVQHVQSVLSAHARSLTSSPEALLTLFIKTYKQNLSHLYAVTDYPLPNSNNSNNNNNAIKTKKNNNNKKKYDEYIEILKKIYKIIDEEELYRILYKQITDYQESIERQKKQPYIDNTIFYVDMHGEFDFVKKEKFIVPLNIVLILLTPVNRFGLTCNITDNKNIHDIFTIPKLNPNATPEEIQESKRQHACRQNILQNILCIDKIANTSNLNNRKIFNFFAFLDKALVLLPGQQYYNLNLRFTATDNGKNMGIFQFNKDGDINILGGNFYNATLKIFIDHIPPDPDDPTIFQYIFVNCCRNIDESVKHTKNNNTITQNTEYGKEIYIYENFMLYFNTIMSSCNAIFRSNTCLPKLQYLKHNVEILFNDINEKFIFVYLKQQIMDVFKQYLKVNKKIIKLDIKLTDEEYNILNESIDINFDTIKRKIIIDDLPFVKLNKILYELLNKINLILNLIINKTLKKKDASIQLRTQIDKLPNLLSIITNDDQKQIYQIIFDSITQLINAFAIQNANNNNNNIDKHKQNIAHISNLLDRLLIKLKTYLDLETRLNFYLVESCKDKMFKTMPENVKETKKHGNHRLGNPGRDYLQNALYKHYFSVE